jgi:hypothetical protein
MFLVPKSGRLPKRQRDLGAEFTTGILVSDIQFCAIHCHSDEIHSADCPSAGRHSLERHFA